MEGSTGYAELRDGPEWHYGRKIKGVPEREKATRFFRENAGDPPPSASYDGNRGIRMVGYGGFEGFLPSVTGKVPAKDASPGFSDFAFFPGFFVAARIFGESVLSGAPPPPHGHPPVAIV